jgi:hypothetical protein
VQLTFHSGASWVPGTSILHIAGAQVDGAELTSRWSLLESRGLARPDFHVDRDGNGIVHAHGGLTRGVALDLAREALTAPLHHVRGEAFARTLDRQRLRSWFFDASFGHYERHARRRGWVYQVAMFDSTPVHVFGIGRYARTLVLNMDESAKPAIVFAGRDKVFGRSLLRSYGLAIAPGTVAKSSAEAVEAARRLGYPVVLKGPASGDSDHVLSEIRDDRNCREGAEEVLRRFGVVIVERLVRGPQYRLQFVNGMLHAVFECNRLKVVGDGTSSLLDLLRRHYPTYLDVIQSHESRRRGLVNLTWYLGIRAIDDLARSRPAKGEEVSISAATGLGAMTACAKSAIHRADRRTLERMLDDLGAPSVAIDLVLPRFGARLSEGGAMFEINAPCGFSYLPDADRAVAAELDGMVARTPGFERAGGRVPVWLIATDAFSRSERARVGRWFRTRYPRGRPIEIGPDSDWLMRLSDRSADAFLVLTTGAAIDALGMPMNLKPRCVHSSPARTFRLDHPRLCATIANAGGSLRSLKTFDA